MDPKKVLFSGGWMMREYWLLETRMATRRMDSLWTWRLSSVLTLSCTKWKSFGGDALPLWCGWGTRASMGWVYRRRVETRQNASLGGRGWGSEGFFFVER